MNTSALLRTQNIQISKYYLVDDDWYVDSSGMNYTPTDVRLEGLANPRQFRDSLNSIANQEQIVIFTHE